MNSTHTLHRVVIYAAGAITHLFHCRPAEFRETAALTQIELKELNVFNGLFGECMKI